MDTISAEQIGRLAMLLEQRGVGQSGIQFAIENVDALAEYVSGGGEYRRISSCVREFLGKQIEILIISSAHEYIGVSERDYRDQAETAIDTFVWDHNLGAIGLGAALLVDYRLTPEFVRQFYDGHRFGFDPSDCTNCHNTETPTDQMMVIQCQLDVRYQDQTPHWCYENLHPFEQGMTLIECLTIFLYGRMGTLFTPPAIQGSRDWSIYALGSMYKDDFVPVVRTWTSQYHGCRLMFDQGDRYKKTSSLRIRIPTRGKVNPFGN